MALIVKNDEQIRVGVTAGLVAGSSSFVFDGTLGKPDYRGYEIIISEVGRRSPMIKNFDYSWNPDTGSFALIIADDEFALNQWYNVHFQPARTVVYPFGSYLISNGFFIRDINIPNIAKVGDASLEKLNSFIERYEPECMSKVIGDRLYDLLLTETSERMDKLIYGSYITGTNEKWKGLVYGESLDTSLIAYYIYFYLQETNAVQTTGVGSKTSKSESGVSVSPADKMIKAWMNFSKDGRACAYFLRKQKNADNSVMYPEYSSSNYCYTNEICKIGGVNLFGF